MAVSVQSDAKRGYTTATFERSNEPQPPCNQRNVCDRLKALEECKELLTEEEYNEKRRSIINAI